MNQILFFKNNYKKQKYFVSGFLSVMKESYIVEREDMILSDPFFHPELVFLLEGQMALSPPTSTSDADAIILDPGHFVGLLPCLGITDKFV